MYKHVRTNPFDPIHFLTKGIYNIVTTADIIDPLKDNLVNYQGTAKPVFRKINPKSCPQKQKEIKSIEHLSYNSQLGDIVIQKLFWMHFIFGIVYLKAIFDSRLNVKNSDDCKTVFIDKIPFSLLLQINYMNCQPINCDCFWG